MQKKSMKINAVLNGIKTLVTILFPIITFPYIMRVLGADNIGKINFANSIANYFQLIAALGVSSYAIREGAALRKDKTRISEFSRQIFSINLVTMVIAYVLLIITLVVSTKIRSYGTIIFIQSLNVFFTVIGVEWIYSIYEDYLYITIRTILVQLVSLILTFALVRTPEDYVTYVWISVLASGGANLINFFYAFKYCSLVPTAHMQMRKHLKPMLILGCNTLAVTIYVNSDITILGFMKDDYCVGIYSNAVKIYTVLKQIINALIVVSLPRLSALYGNGDYKQYNGLIEKVLKSLMILLLPVVTGLILLSNELVVLISGPEYAEGAAALRILSIAIAFSILASFFTTAILLPRKKEKYILRATMISAVVNIALNFVLIPVFSERGAAMTTVLAEFLAMTIAMRYARGDYAVSGVKHTFLRSMCGCLGIIGVCTLLRCLIHNYVLYTVISVVCSIMIYGIIMIVLKDDIVCQILKDLRNRADKRRM
ncbi:MAG: flippase [Firmicutes bacterium]|nr:flippase [Bacillota bacterium]MDY2819285.1 flippase [Hominisplanchenecus sp.]